MSNRCVFLDRDETITLEKSGLIKTIQERHPNYRSLAIHESSPSGPASAKLKKECPGYLPTQFFPNQLPGEAVTDWGDDLPQRIEGVSGLPTEMLTFNDRSMGLDAKFLDVFISRKPLSKTGP